MQNLPWRRSHTERGICRMWWLHNLPRSSYGAPIGRFCMGLASLDVPGAGSARHPCRAAPRTHGWGTRPHGCRRRRPLIYAACASTAGKSIDTPRGTTSTGQVAFSISLCAWALSST
jgi:hypothetical protein